MSQFIATNVDRYLRRLFPNVSVTIVNRPELYATQVCIQVMPLSGEPLIESHFIARESMKSQEHSEHLAYEIATNTAHDVMLRKPTYKE